MFGFFGNIFTVTLLVVFIIVAYSLAQTALADKRKDPVGGWQAARRIRWYLKNNNGWLALLILTTLIVFFIAIRKTTLQSSLRWEIKNSYYKSETAQKIVTELPTIVEGSKLRELSDLARENPQGQIIKHTYGKGPVKDAGAEKYQDKNRPTNLIWWLRFFLLLHLIPIMTFYSYSDETVIGIKAVIERKKLRDEEQKNKPKEEKASRVTMTGVFLSDITAEFIKLFAESFSLFGRGR